MREFYKGALLSGEKIYQSNKGIRLRWHSLNCFKRHGPELLKVGPPWFSAERVFSVS